MFSCFWINTQEWNSWVLWSIFTFLRNLHNVLHNDCTNLYSHKKLRSVPFSSRLHQHLLFTVYLNKSYSDRCEQVSYCGLTCISLMISDVEHHFVSLLTIYTTSLEICLFGFCAYVLIELFMLNCMSCLLYF